MTDNNGAPAQLVVRDLVAGYGRLPVLHGLSLDVAAGAMVAIIGPNGAGKSTLTKAIMRLVEVMGGEIRFEGTRIDGLEPQAIAALGVGYVPQTRNVFGALSVEENLELSCNLLPRGAAGAAIEAIYARFPRLRQRRSQKGASLSGGERQMLAIGSALISNPKLIILDEPTSGLSPHMTTEVAEGIKAINDAGTTVIWVVEENPQQILALADWVYVLDGGTVRMSCAARDLLGAENFRELFLGV
ncbi:ABC transporter ATP-binding protein [Methylobrevis pamukkalensis]|uniref:High-affinity branched-chain amino acid transport ATP-binding protein LivF n=1 Tax=Methylobrevis pamukkalensis TaxID=1439726 RepID=A0A1E3H7M5_9HYPH|nr:ABC transporter ATP-binding protein [Methylobrevis pamukkalensis]ODN72304.1 High-affinity branched-chain amino acid transport ATP-binding protein LivF [Methylobrevis pamukkalensis]